MDDRLEPLLVALDLGHRSHIAAAIKSVSDRDLAPSKIVPFVLRRFCAKCLWRDDNPWALRALYRCIERLESRQDTHAHRTSVVDALELVTACSSNDGADPFFAPSPDERRARLSRIQRIVETYDSSEPPHPCIVRGFRDGLLPSCLPLMQRLVESCTTDGDDDDDARCIAWYLLLHARPCHLFVDPKNVTGMRDGTDALFRILLDVANDHWKNDETLLRYVVLCKDLYYHRRRRGTERWALAWAACRALIERGRTLRHQEHDLLPRNGLTRPPTVNPLFAYTYRTCHHAETTTRRPPPSRSRGDDIRRVGLPRGTTELPGVRVQRLMHG